MRFQKLILDQQPLRIIYDFLPLRNSTVLSDDSIQWGTNNHVPKI